LEVDLRPADLAGEARRVVDGARPADVVGELGAELGLERRVALGLLVACLQLVDAMDERLGDEAAAIGAEMPALVGLVVVEKGWHEDLRRPRPRSSDRPR